MVEHIAVWLQLGRTRRLAHVGIDMNLCVYLCMVASLRGHCGISASVRSTWARVETQSTALRRLGAASVQVGSLTYRAVGAAKKMWGHLRLNQLRARSPRVTSPVGLERCLGPV